MKKTKHSKLIVTVVVVVVVVALALGLYFGLTSMKHGGSIPMPTGIPIGNSIVRYIFNGTTSSNNGSCGPNILTNTITWSRREAVQTYELDVLKTNLVLHEQNKLVLSYDKSSNQFSLSLRGAPVSGFSGKLLGTMNLQGALGQHFAYLDFQNVPASVKDMLPKSMVTKYYHIEDYTNSQLPSAKLFVLSNVDLLNDTYCIDPTIPNWKTPIVLMA